MIVFFVTAESSYTLKAVALESPGVAIRVVSYDQLFNRPQLPRATYVFTDTDRLPIWRIHLAAQVYRRLRDRGYRVLNDPARMPSRYGLLRKLHRAGINDFDAYRVEGDFVPKRWPVFLRSEGDHYGPLSRLLVNMSELERAIDTAVSNGTPISGLLLIEYAAEPVRPGLFRKLGVFRIGSVTFASNCDHEDKWVVKNGIDGIAPPELYADDLRIVRDNPFGPTLNHVFELASMEYGRADFGLVDGRVQVYEINSNPNVQLLKEHPSPFRIESFAIFKQHFYEALAEIDTAAP